MLHYTFILLVLFNLTKCETLEVNLNYNYTYLNGSTINNTKGYCLNRRCIIKCCKENEFFNKYYECEDMKSKSVNVTIQDIIVNIYKNDIEREIARSDMTLKNFTFLNYDKFFETELYGLPYSLPNMLDIKVYLVEDATLVSERLNYVDPFIRLNSLTDYCLEMRIVRNKTHVFFAFDPNQGTDGNTETQKEIQNEIFTPISMLVSCFFMMLVLIVYGLLPKLRNLKGKVLMGYVASLFVWFLIRAITNLYSFTPEQCNILSPIIYFAFLGSCMWMNIMSFDIWRTFRAVCKMQHKRRGDFAKFIWYCLCAWGVPLAVTIGTTVLQNSDVPTYIIKPHFDSCLYYVSENLLFMYIPIGIVMAVNCLLFLLTIYNIWLIKKGIGSFDAKDSQNNKNKDKFCVYLKVSVMMGINWILEIIQTFAGITSVWLFILVNLYNTLIGVAIFFIFVFKKSVYMMLLKKYYKIRNISKTIDSSTKYTGKSESSRNYSTTNQSQLTSEIEIVEIGLEPKEECQTQHMNN